MNILREKCFPKDLPIFLCFLSIMSEERAQADTQGLALKKPSSACTVFFLSKFLQCPAHPYLHFGFHHLFPVQACIFEPHISRFISCVIYKVELRDQKQRKTLYIIKRITTCCSNHHLALPCLCSLFVGGEDGLYDDFST